MNLFIKSINIFLIMKRLQKMNLLFSYLCNERNKKQGTILLTFNLRGNSTSAKRSFLFQKEISLGGN